MTSTESPLSVTFKPHTGYDAPLLTIRADTPEELVLKLQQSASNDLLSAVGRLSGMFEAQFNLGKGLGGQHTNNPDGSGGGSAPVAAPPAPAPVAPPTPVDPWGGQPQQAQAAPQYAAPAQQYAAPQPVAQAAPAAPSIPGAPLILGIPAKLKEGQSARGTWRAWADPREMNAVRGIEQKTDDPNHPGLAAGTHKFWSFIKG